MGKSTAPARAIGLITFVFGIAVLVSVLVISFRWFVSPNHWMTVIKTPASGPSAADRLGVSAVTAFLQIGLLFMMLLVGSILTGRGIQFYYAAEQQFEHE